jgi:hypothetical protein
VPDFARGIRKTFFYLTSESFTESAVSWSERRFIGDDIRWSWHIEIFFSVWIASFLAMTSSIPSASVILLRIFFLKYYSLLY